MSQFERDAQNARIAERKTAAKEKHKPVVVARPEPPRTFDGGTRTSPAVEAARQAMNAERQRIQEDASRASRYAVVTQDAATVAALFEQWVRQNPGFVSTEHNRISIMNAIDECLYMGDPLSIKLFDDIFAYLVENNHLQRSGHLRVRGQGGVMVGPPTIYQSQFQKEGKEMDTLVRKRGVGSAQTVSDDISVREARHMPLAELAARARATRNGAVQPQASTENISETEAREMPLSELRKRVQAGYGKGRQ